MMSMRHKVLRNSKFCVAISILIIFVLISYSNVDFGSLLYRINLNGDDLSHRTTEIFVGEKYVHLDLKGAPPKISYYENLFPLLAKLGATGLLIEYEDMFPYTGDLLKNIPAYNAYSLIDIERINSLAEKNNLSIVPLIQSFGHLEFMLKLKEFSYLREVQRYPQVICPTNNMTHKILFSMISQMIEAHPRSTMIHIGGDEVYHIGVCDNCMRTMEEENINRNGLFLMHIGAVARIIRKKYPKIYILMWDDEFRSMTQSEIEDSTLSSLVEPVVWTYDVSVVKKLGYNLFDTYSEVFPKLWIASAFKGATGSNKYITTMSHHMQNHESWMSIYHKYKTKIHIKGILITGWQRFDHFAVLCELLPVGIPSLAMSFALLLGYNLTYLYTLPEEVTKVLQCQNPSGLLGYEYGEPYCSFPGGQVLDLILGFHRIKQEYNLLLKDSRIKGWMRSYNFNHNFSSPDHIYSVLPNFHNIMSQLMYLQSHLSEALLNIYDNYTVTEWMETYYIPFFDEVKSKFEATNKLLLINHWPRRPLVSKIEDL